MFINIVIIELCNYMKMYFYLKYKQHEIIVNSKSNYLSKSTQHKLNINKLLQKRTGEQKLQVKKLRINIEVIQYNGYIINSTLIE